MSTEVVFRIADSWSPGTLPMQRLGEYLIELAALYGEQANVHFKRIRKGSAVLVSRIDEPAVPKVLDRLAAVSRLDAPKDIRRAFETIDRMLAADNARATVKVVTPALNWAASTSMIVFPGRGRSEAVDFGAVRRAGFLDGELIRIGGKDETVHLQLQDGDIFHTNIVTNRDLGRQLGHLLFGPTIRLWGTGSWRRGDDGLWTVVSFRVSRFEKLKDFDDLTKVVEELRNIRGSAWHLETDPVATLLAARHNHADDGDL
ncbi:MAG: hypothetical protein K0Q54_3045 [Methylobacterium brachiatum]|jgi:hypothetical protein|nr:hypothetical protein [Methylobacterium brachiatum]